ncbi:unnamed protein product [Dracunculus medinensis]|uniref:LIM zinc-binding domain-containing protein n=1 Tax=Dracunculus medinensis TaxID=318479 RepID=A0A0N4UGW4_DRAME|nr:unnamed protein product [Dracunculus medinensis]
MNSGLDLKASKNNFVTISPGATDILFSLACYFRLFATKCTRCGIALQPNDFVFRCLSSIYHANCFSCIYCSHLLKKGDQYLIINGQIICRNDYEIFLCNQALHPGFTLLSHHTIYFNVEQNEMGRKTPKRPRTILNTQQRRAFKVAFEKSAKPCRKIREQLAKETGLSVRVVQMKKILRKQEMTRVNGTVPPESDAKSIDDSKSNLDSDDDLESIDEIENENSSNEEKLKELTNPIDKLYNMQATYFDFT